MMIKIQIQALSMRFKYSLAKVISLAMAQYSQLPHFHINCGYILIGQKIKLNYQINEVLADTSTNI